MDENLKMSIASVAGIYYEFYLNFRARCNTKKEAIELTESAYKLTMETLLSQQAQTNKNGSSSGDLYCSLNDILKGGNSDERKPSKK